MLDTQRNAERAKYHRIYNGDSVYPNYGSTHHFAAGLTWITQHINSLLDVGCGDNELAKIMRSEGKRAMGVDFASPRADAIASAHDLPCGDGSFQFVTAFDMLEHLLPGEVDGVLAEFRRVASVGWMFSISYVPSKNYDLHPTVRPKEWWVQKIGQYGTVTEHGEYLICRFPGAE